MKKTIAAIAAFAAVLSMTPGLSAADESDAKKGPFAAADANGDGKLNLAEYTQMVSKRMDAEKAKVRFAKLDTNGDGLLTHQEFRAAMEKAKKAEKASKKRKEEAPN